MARHSKWHKIKHGKAITDKKRGKTFTKHAKLVEVAARSGGDPEMNPVLRSAIENARADNVPYENIDRAIKKGTGDSKEASNIEEVMYEGFGPGGSALYIQALTDNRNRTITNLKIIMGKHGGTMGASGSVGYLFERKGIIEVTVKDGENESVEMTAIDAGAEDIEVSDGGILITTKDRDLAIVRDALTKSGYKCNSAELEYVAVTENDLSDADMEKLDELVELLEEDDDVLNVYTNAG